MNALEDRIRTAFEPYRLPPEVLRRVSRRQPRRRRVRTVLGALAAAVVLALSLPFVLPADVPGGADPAAAAILRRFSSIALKSPGESGPQPGQYVYEKIESRGLVAFVSSGTGISFRYWVSDKGERWLGTDGSGRSRGTVGEPTFLTPADRAAYERYLDSPAREQEWGRFDWGRSYTDRYRPGELTFFFDFSDLPTDVDVLRGMLERREIIGGPPGDWETFNLAADMLTWGYAPPQLRAALFQVMAGLSGVELIGRTEDALGRVGIAVGYTHDDQRQEVVFERSTGAVLERRWVSVSGDLEPPSPEDVCSGGPPGGCGATEIAIAGPPGSMSSVTTYEVYGKVVDKIGEVPDR